MQIENKPLNLEENTMTINLHLSEIEARWVLELVRESERWLDDSEQSATARAVNHRLSHELESKSGDACEHWVTDVICGGDK